MNSDEEDDVRDDVSDEEQTQAKNRRKVIEDDEAEDEEGKGRGGNDADSEEEEEEGPDEYEKDGFIVDEEEEEEVEEEEEERKKKRKKKKRRALELDEEDYELLEEHNVTGFQRPPRKKGDKQFKRLKKAGKGGAAETGEASPEPEDGGGGRRGALTEEELKRDLFGDDDGLPEDADEVEEESDQGADEEVEEEDEMADFIVDEEVQVDENGEPIQTVRKKKKKKRASHAGVADAAAYQEAAEIFGDADELLREFESRKARTEGEEDDLLDEDDYEDYPDEDEDEDGYRRPRPKAGTKALRAAQKQFEPSILAEKYMTDRDEAIRQRDVPERLQLLEEAVGELPEDEDPIPEAEWIWDRLFGRNAVYHSSLDNLSRLARADAVKEISHVLHRVHDNKEEVPFIGLHRREECKTIVEGDSQAAPDQPSAKLSRFEGLWTVAEEDKRWLLLQKRKRQLEAAWSSQVAALLAVNMEGGNEQEMEQAEEAKRALLEQLRAANSESAIDDVECKYRLVFPPGDIADAMLKKAQLEGSRGTYARPKRQSRYALYKKAGVGLVGKALAGMSAEKLGDNLKALYRRNDPEEQSKRPDELVQHYLTSKEIQLSNVEAVLRGARHMVAVEIAAEPSVRDHVRGVFMENAVVTSRPTKKGFESVDEFHRYFPVKWLKEKPIATFDDHLWLLIEHATSEGLISSQIVLPQQQLKNLTFELEERFISDNVSTAASLWDTQRRLVLGEALSGLLLPAMDREARALLAGRARRWVASKIEELLWKMVSIAPYSRQRVDDQDEDEYACRVMACCWGPGKPPTSHVVVDETGDMTDFLHTAFLGQKGLPGLTAQQRVQDDTKRLINFIKQHQPHVALVGGANMQCRRVKDELHEATIEVAEEDARNLAEGLDSLPIYFASETVPGLFATARAAEELIPGQPEIIRKAIALARYLQNPLAVLASLCGAGKEILLLRLHSMQEYLTAEELWEAIERVMVTITAQVGVDVNTAIQHEWQLAPLQFVPGLGPRKAMLLQRAILSRGRVTTRKEVLTDFLKMQRRVFINAAASLRVRAVGAAANADMMDRLDDTRIHPEQYELAKKMAQDAYLEDQQGSEDPDEETLELAVEHVTEHPNLLANLDIAGYIKELERTGLANKRETLYMMRDELMHPYAEWRKPFEQPGMDEEFSMLSGENDETLHKGKVIQVTVRKVQGNAVIAGLESGLVGRISARDFTDTENAEDALMKLQEGTVITARVKEVHKNRYMVELTCRGSDLRDEKGIWRPLLDRYFLEDKDFIQQQQQDQKKAEKKADFISRKILHPMFKNLSLQDACQALTERDVGDVVIRPSSRGVNHLTITVKFYNNVYSHIDVRESGKDKKDITSSLKLGQELTIGNETFEDLDEVMARYVEPLVSYLKKMIAHRKFLKVPRPGKAELDEVLRREKQEKPQLNPYYVGVSHEHPGAFLLGYIRSTTPHHEYIGVSPAGYRFWKKTFTDPDKLFGYFKANINNPPEEVRRSRASLASMVPRRTPQNDPAPQPAWGGGHSQWNPPTNGASQPYHNGAPAAAAAQWQGYNWAPPPEAPPQRGGWEQGTGWGSGWSQPHGQWGPGPPQASQQQWDYQGQGQAPQFGQYGAGVGQGGHVGPGDRRHPSGYRDRTW